MTAMIFHQTNKYIEELTSQAKNDLWLWNKIFEFQKRQRFPELTKFGRMHLTFT